MSINIFIVLLLIAAYPYIIYPIIGCVIVCIKRLFSSNKKHHYSTENKTITLLIAAYNEELFINEKIKNTKELDYPKDKFKVIFVTDGSDDKTPEIVSAHKEFIHMHLNERRGKIHAMHRGVLQADSEIVVFCDANTYLNSDSLKHISNAFANPKVGCVSGEKRVISDEKDSAAPAGEGFYWKFESFLKKIDSELYTAVGAAGELFAIRRELYEEIPNDTILDDFLITLSIVKKRYKIKYEPRAIASEYGSVSVKEEMKRKYRISAGCFQVLFRNPWLINIFKYPVVAFQFISHKLMRWLTTPLIIAILIPYNIALAVIYPNNTLIITLLILQGLFYLFSIIGYFVQHLNLKNKFIFIPYYFTMANIAQFVGLWRFIKGNTNVKWERAERIKKE